MPVYDNWQCVGRIITCVRVLSPLQMDVSMDASSLETGRKLCSRKHRPPDFVTYSPGDQIYVLLSLSRALKCLLGSRRHTEGKSLMESDSVTANPHFRLYSRDAVCGSQRYSICNVLMRLGGTESRRNVMAFTIRGLTLVDPAIHSLMRSAAGGTRLASCMTASLILHCVLQVK